MLVTYEEAFEEVARCLRVAGVPKGAAEVQARWLVEADVRGHASHGMRRLPVLLERIRRRLICPDAVTAFDWRSNVVVSVDGGWGLGPPTLLNVLAAVSPVAADQGIALAAVRRCAHLGILAPYVEQLAEAGLVGIVLTTSEALVHPWGGRGKMVGTNPIAIGVPARPPLVMDLATSVVSMGKILDHLARNRPLEPGWAVDSDGNPTSDPLAAAGGALSPFGGAKGYALGVTLEVLVALLTGTSTGTGVTGTLDVEDPVTKGDLVIVINPEVVGAAGTAGIDDYLNELRTATPSSAGGGVSVPGDGARRRRRAAMRSGFEIDDTVWTCIRQLEQDHVENMRESGRTSR